MPMTASGLADAIRSAMGFPPPTSAQLTAWATGVVTALQTLGIVANAPGTVTGTAPPSGGPLSGGAASGGLITGLTGSATAALVCAADPVDYPAPTAQLTGFCDGIMNHIMLAGTVSFDSGSIAGACANTPTSPGPFVGTGTGGKISGLSGAAMAAMVASSAGFPGTTPQLILKCTAIADYVMDNASVVYSTVTGTVSAGGGPLIAGTAAGGKIL